MGIFSLFSRIGNFGKDMDYLSQELAYDLVGGTLEKLEDDYEQFKEDYTKLKERNKQFIVESHELRDKVYELKLELRDLNSEYKEFKDQLQDINRPYPDGGADRLFEMYDQKIELEHEIRETESDWEEKQSLVRKSFENIQLGIKLETMLKDSIRVAERANSKNADLYSKKNSQRRRSRK